MTAQLSNVTIDISKHPLIKQAYEVCQAIEKCGASPELTDAVTKACALMQGIANAMDSEPYGYVHQAIYEDNGSCGLSNDHEAHRDSNTHIPLFRHPVPPAPVAVPDKWPNCSDVGFGTYDGCVSVVTPSGKIADIDACLVSEVVGLWQQGITTVESCCGHNKASSYIAVVPTDNGKMLMLGYIPSTESGAPHIFYSKTSKHGVNDKIEILQTFAEDSRSKSKIDFDPKSPFIQHIKKCSEEVATWPEWKKGGSDPLTPLGIKSLSHLSEEASHVKTN